MDKKTAFRRVKNSKRYLPPLKIIAKGKDWVDWQRVDGLQSRAWKGVSSDYRALSKLRKGSYFLVIKREYEKKGRTRYVTR